MEIALRVSLSALLSLVIMSSAIFPQEQYGNVRRIVVDERGIPLPGVILMLESPLFATRNQTTSDGGIFRFLNITPGLYSLKCILSGFKTYIQQNLDIRVGTNFDLKIPMTQVVLEEIITVVAQSPIVDAKKVGTGANVTLIMLQEIPSARDPWVIIQQLPGVGIGQENVGGSTAGTQSAILSKGSWWQDFNLDGVPITDLASESSPFYYDFDTFQEIEVVTTGHDASIQAGGVSINFVTRRGGNKFQGTARAYFTNTDLQGDNRTDELKELGYVGNRIRQLADYGFQLGGPILEDRLWFWLGYGIQDIRLLTIDGSLDSTVIRSFNAKLNFHPSSANRMEFAYMFPSKNKDGRGASLTRRPAATWNQRPSGLGYFKLEDEHMFSDRLLLSLKLAYINSGFSMTPQGGAETQQSYDVLTRVYSDSAEVYDYDRPSYTSTLAGNWFVEKLLGASHEFKFGAEFRLNQDWDNTRYAGDVFKRYRKGVPYSARIAREQATSSWASRYSAYINDLICFGRMSLSLRLDREHGWLAKTSISASRLAPDLLPAMTIPAIDPGIVQWTLSPRFGFTLNATGDGKTVIRGNIALFRRPWLTDLMQAVSPAVLSWAAFYWNDLNADNRVSLNELDGYPWNIIGFSGFNPANPTSLSSPNALDTNLTPPRTTEIQLGVEREVFPDFSLSANAFLRRYSRIIWNALYDKASGTKVTRADYIGPISGSETVGGITYNYSYWTLNKTRPAGILVENSDYRETYAGFEITAVKRLSRRWMMNASFTWQDHRSRYGEQGWAGDPTNIEFWEGMPAGMLSGRWMAKCNFLYQLPWGMNLSGFFNAREGYVIPVCLIEATPERAAVALDAYMELWFENYGERTLPVFYNLDLGLSQEIRLKDIGRFVLCLDVFNVFNFAHPLWRSYYANNPSFGQTEKILNPRVVRLGLRYAF